MQLQEDVLFANRYKLKRLLGRGGFSEVWLSEDTLTSLEIALKVYAPGTGMDDLGVKLFSSEFSLVFNLNHTNLLKPTYYDTFENMPYLVLPYCQLGSAFRMVGIMKEEEAWKFLFDITSGLEYLHSQEPPVIHQDIKPDNILIDGSGHYVLTDFGISIKARNTLRKSLLKVNTSVGTLAYMGPERFSKHPLPIKASDVFSLGVTLYELLTGAMPFGEHGGLLLQHGAEIPDIEGCWSEELKGIISLCLQKETWERPTASEIREFVEAYLRGEKRELPIRRNSKSEFESMESSAHESLPDLSIKVEKELVSEEKEDEITSDTETKILDESDLNLNNSHKIEECSNLKFFSRFLKKWAKLGIIGFVLIICVCIGVWAMQEMQEKREQDAKLEVLNLNTEKCNNLLHQGDSLLQLGEKTRGDNYELYYKEALAHYDSAAIIADENITDKFELQKIKEKQRLALQKINEAYALFVSSANEVEKNEDYEMAENLFKRATRLSQDSTSLHDFHMRHEFTQKEAN